MQTTKYKTANKISNFFDYNFQKSTKHLFVGSMLYLKKQVILILVYEFWYGAAIIYF